MSKDTLLAIIGMMAICIYTYVLYQALANHYKFSIFVVCVVIAAQYVDYRHKQSDTLMDGFINELYGRK